MRIIEVVAAGGIDIEESRRIGEAWNAARDAGDPESSWMSAGDVSLYMTGKDTALKALNMAYWNYFGEFAPGVTGANLATWGVSDMVSPKPAAYNQSYNVPDPPQPPSYISVRTLAGEDLPQPDGTTSPSYGIEVRFTLESETNAGDHDTGVSDFLGYRVMRKAGSRNAPWEIVADGPASDFASAPSTTAPDVLGVDYTLPAGRIFIDGGTILGRDYWYSVVAYDDGSQNWARPGQALESSRWWTYSGFTNVGVVGNSAASTVLDEIVVVPNPWISSGQTFGSPGNIAGYERIRFGNVPDPCTIKILTTAGNLVTTLEHSGSGDYLWDGRNADNQYVVSDVYIYVVEHETLGRKIGKFIVIR